MMSIVRGSRRIGRVVASIVLLLAAGVSAQAEIGEVSMFCYSAYNENQNDRTSKGAAYFSKIFVGDYEKQAALSKAGGGDFFLHVRKLDPTLEKIMRDRSIGNYRGDVGGECVAARTNEDAERLKQEYETTAAKRGVIKEVDWPK